MKRNRVLTLGGFVGRLVTWLVVLLALTGCEKARLDAQVRELCAKDGGTKIYEEVILPPDVFEGLLNRYGDLNVPGKREAANDDLFYIETDTKVIVSGNPEMWRSEYRLVRKADNTILATQVFYGRRGGDMIGPWHESSFGCPDPKSTPNLASLVIKKSRR